MTDQALSSLPIALVGLGGLLLVIASALAVRRRSQSHSFGWIVVACLTYSILSMAAAMHVRSSDGLRAAVMQFVAVLLAAGLGYLCIPQQTAAPSSPSALATAGRALAWLTLLGFPPTVGFHGKLMVYRAILLAGWPWLLALAMAASLAALLPALWGIRASGSAHPRGVHSLAIVALMLVITVLGVYPQSGMALLSRLEQPAAASETGVASELDVW